MPHLPPSASCARRTGARPTKPVRARRPQRRPPESPLPPAGALEASRCAGRKRRSDGAGRREGWAGLGPAPLREAPRPGAGDAQAYRFSLLTTRLLLEDGGGVVSAIQDCLSYPLQCPFLISCLNQNYYQCLLQNEVIGLQSWPSRRFCGLSQLSRCCVSVAARMKVVLGPETTSFSSNV
ncbi:uncharacterized protein [Symphalangus syndactylus]|uniref:uncharacterized protein n=1 Tax=Symphalangus syndactylus TaxID=9590 RepID=UPI0030056297